MAEVSFHLQTEKEETREFRKERDGYSQNLLLVVEVSNRKLCVRSR